MAPMNPATVDAPPTARMPWFTSILDMDTVTQNPDELACLNIRAPVPHARKAAIGEMPRVASIGSTSAAAVMTPSALDPVTTWMMAAMMIGIRMAGKEDCTMMSAIFSATPAFFTKVARAPPYRLQR